MTNDVVAQLRADRDYWYLECKNTNKRVEELRAELATETKARKAYADKWPALVQERDALRAQLDEAREALEPFSFMATELEYEGSKWRDYETHWMQAFGFKLEPTVGDLRRARAVLDKIKGGGDEKAPV